MKYGNFRLDLGLDFNNVINELLKKRSIKEIIYVLEPYTDVVGLKTTMESYVLNYVKQNHPDKLYLITAYELNI